MPTAQSALLPGRFPFAATLAALVTLLAGCGGEPDGARGPQVSYVNTTGYDNYVLIGWEEAPDTNLYALTKSDGRSAQLFWLGGTEFLDTQMRDERYAYSLRTQSLAGLVSRPGTRVVAQNNRALVAELNDALRAARSPDEVKSVLIDSMEHDFYRIFVGLDSLGLTFSDRALLFSFFVAHNFAPYEHSTKFELMELLREPVLDCDNYLALTASLFELLTDGTRPASLVFYGFDGGPIGNHAQLLYTPDAGGEVWLVDPTVGLLARYRSAEELLAGNPPRRVSDYYGYYESDTQPPDMIDYEKRIRAAVEAGGYAPDQMIYRYRSLADFVEYHFIQRSERIE